MEKQPPCAGTEPGMSMSLTKYTENNPHASSRLTAVGHTSFTPVEHQESNSVHSGSSSSRIPSMQREAVGGGAPLATLLGTGGGGGGTGATSTTHPLVLSKRASVRGKSSVHKLTRHAISKQNTFTVQLDGDSGGIEMQAASRFLLSAVDLREKYKSIDKGQREGTKRLVPPVTFSFESGIIQFSDQHTVIVPWEQFYEDVMELYATMQHPDCRRTCINRLQVLEEKYNLYRLCHGEAENSDRHRRGGGVFADCTKVDNGVYLSCIMNAQWLHEYIQNTIEHSGDDLVRLSGDKGEAQSLHTVCEQLGLGDLSYMNVEGLGLMPPNERRLYNYDVLDPELNHGGRSSAELLQLFLTPDTVNNGVYFAEAVRPIIDLNEARRRSIQATECMLELSGVSFDCWERLVSWLEKHELLERRHNRWLIALPRRQMCGDSVKNAFEHHQQHLENIFFPLFMATLAPEDPKNVQLATFLANIGGFVIVSDEEERESEFQRKPRRPVEVSWSEKVCDLYFAYYVWANLCSLNAFRRRKGLNTLQLRAFAGGRTSQTDVLVYSYLLCDGLVNGVILEHHPVLQYLYGVHKIALIMSPLGNHVMGLPYMQNPFPVFFRRGLKVALTTNRPLLFHHSNEPIIEEYGMASKLYELSGTDICEIALNSVLVSSFPVETKGAWLGDAFVGEGFRSNAVDKSKVPNSRLELRHDMWQTELQLIKEATRQQVRAEETESGARPTSSSTLAIAGISGSVTGTGAGDVGGMSLVQGTVVVQSSQLPYFVRDPHTNFPRVVFLSQLDRDPSNITVAQMFHHALELRSQYVRLHRASDVGARKIMKSDEIEHAFRRDDTFDESEWMFFNAVDKSKVPNSRLELRHDMWQTELQLIKEATRQQVRAEETESGARPTSSSTLAIAGISGSVTGTGAGDVGGMSLVQGTVVVQSALPYFVRDPHTNFPRVVFLSQLDRDPSNITVAQMFHHALELRSQYVRLHRASDVGARKIMKSDEIEHAFRRDDTFDESEWMFKTVEGILVPHEVHQIPRLPKDMFHYDDFRFHVHELRMMLENVHVRSFATRQLNLLERKFMLHLAVNRSLEAGTTANKASHNRDFYQATKVDNNVRMASGMTARQLLNFIVSKANNNGDDIVAHQEGKEPQTLRQLLHELNISANSLTVDDLNVQVDATLGVASALYTPEGRDVLANANEWELLSDWFDTHGMASVHNQWMVQIPRIYSYLRKRGKVQSFAEYIENIFKPLWTVSLHPSKNPRLFHFINHISGFDCVEDERRPDSPLNIATKPPHEWTTEDEPPYNYYMYHVWANIYSLNEFRRRRKFSTFTFRPSCGETGPVDHLIGGFLLANAINYGVTLAEDATLQYLFYLARIGVTVSPLSNNTKVLGYLDNPFPTFFRRGLNVSLGTDSPLMFHHTQEPLLEEYSIASKVWKLGPNDMCEIARNSVLLSGFDAAFKRERLGDLYFLSSSRSNDASHTHLSDIRVAFRFETYHTEIAMLEMISGLVFPKAFLTLNEERAQEADFYEAVKKKKEVPLGGIIEVKPNDIDIGVLQQNRSLLQRQLEEINSTVETLRHQNKQLTEKLAEERTRDQYAQQLRRRGHEQRWGDFMDAEMAQLTAAAGADALGHTMPPPLLGLVDDMSWEGGPGPVDELNKSIFPCQLHPPDRLHGEGDAIPFSAFNATITRAGGTLTSNTTAVGFSSEGEDTTSATAALVGFSESMWKGSENASAPHKRLTSHSVSGGSALPPIGFDASTTVRTNKAVDTNSNSRPLPTPPRRESRGHPYVYLASLLPGSVAPAAQSPEADPSHVRQQKSKKATPSKTEAEGL
uniref:Putative adenosine monophosphate deaminase n=1 Tax=Trypanosoma vivax (strain Y486) TaxID=1055687 RepID=G0U2F4_TRYVY|nr:putative adenosine monophosphate deaminase, fragment [Trypanosoma vivax Y486]